MRGREGICLAIKDHGCAVASGGVVGIRRT